MHCMHVYIFQASEKAKYDQVFDSLQPVNNLLAGDKVKPVSKNIAVTLI